MPQPPDTPPYQPVALRWWQKILPRGVLERRLLLVALAGLLPLARLSSFTLLQSTRAQKQQLIQSAQDTMRAVMTAVDSELRLSVAALEALATSPRLARRDLEECLEIEGHGVVEAADGPTGIDAVLRERPDVALVDIGLPGADGYAVARAIRAGGGAGVRLVALSGYGQPEDKARGLQAGFDAYLVKPIDPAVLAGLLAESPPSTGKP